MKYYFCLVDGDDAKSGLNIGRKYAYEKRSKWVEGAEDLPLYLTAGYMKGTDFVSYKGKAYFIMKTYIDLDEDFVLLVCKESEMGCDKPDEVEENNTENNEVEKPEDTTDSVEVETPAEESEEINS